MRKNNHPSHRPKTTRRGPLAIILGGLILLIAAFFIFRGTGNGKAVDNPNVPAGGHLEVDRESVDLGNVPLGQTVQVAFTVTNNGDKPLRFKEAPYIEVKEGC